jgi:hypothetical protein
MTTFTRTATSRFLLFLLLCTAMANAQIVNIPDPVFKAYLLSTAINADTNTNGEIEMSEAAAITILSPNSAVSDFTGLEAFVNLTGLTISDASALNSISAMPGLTSLTSMYVSGNNSITSVSLNQYPNLKFLWLDHLNVCSSVSFSGISLTEVSIAFCDLLTTLDVSSQTNLRRITCREDSLANINLGTLPSLIYLELTSNALTSVDLSGLTILDALLVSDNQLTSLNVSNLSVLTGLIFGGNNIPSIDVANNPLLKSLSCGPNPIPSLNLSNNHNLIGLDVRATPMTTLDLTPITALQSLGISDTALGPEIFDGTNTAALFSLECNNVNWVVIDVSTFTDLNSLYCGGAALTQIFMKNGANTYLELIESPNLLYICTDETNIWLVNATALPFAMNATVNSYCSFIPGGDYNTITGHVNYDIQNDGCGDNDDLFPFNVRMNLTGPSTVSSNFINDAGQYNFYSSTAGNFILTPHLEHPSYFNISPATASFNFPLVNNSVQTQDFCITPNGSHPDLEVVLVPNGAARPGFDASYKVIYKNKGNLVMDGTVAFTFNEFAEFVSAQPAVGSQTPTQLTWNFTNLQPFESRTVNATLNLNSPMENPALNSGDVLHFSASINGGSAEDTPADNVFSLYQPVVNSYDPNDKACLEGNAVLPENIGKYLHYNINFENTGNADAINIVVRDSIDVTKFDIASLQVIHCSHAVETKITGNIVEFIFEGINLPPAIMNPIGGHGNVLFKIKILPTLAEDDSVTNTANIHFDYNHPIATNEARTVFTNLSRTDFNKDKSVTVYPNPVKNKVTVKASNPIKQIQLYDVQGRILQTSIENKMEAVLDISAKPKGIYFLKIITQNGSTTQKIVKE